MLGDIEGLSLLDSFAGSGAIAFEAISRGANNAVAIDSDKNANKTMKENSDHLGISDKIKVIQANAGGWSDNNPEQRFDLVVCDPPFDKLQPTVLNKLKKHVKDEGLFILSYPVSADVPVFESMKCIEHKKYGDAQLIFYKKDV